MRIPSLIFSHAPNEGSPVLFSFTSPRISKRDRIVFADDRGFKITGIGRLDYLLGTGKRAEKLAAKLKPKE